MRTGYDIDNTFREIEDLTLSLIFGGGIVSNSDLGLLGDALVISTVFDQIIHTPKGK